MADKDSGLPGCPAWLRHDIRNPLNVILGHLRLLEAHGVNAAQQRSVEACRTAVDRINALLAPTGDEDAAAAMRQELAAIAAVEVLSKPYSRDALLDVVARHGARRVLAADDDGEARALLSAQLRGVCELDVVDNGRDAVARAADEKIDLVLLDWEMPDKKGPEAAREIRAAETARGAVPVPIVMATAHALDDLARDAPGADGYETVVIADPEIAALVPGFLRQRRHQAARLPDLIDIGDWDAVTSIGHKMKGTGRGYGFPPIAEIGGRLEQAGRNRQRAEALSAAADLTAYLARVRVR